MTKRRVLQVISEKSDIVKINWKGKVPPIMITSIVAILGDKRVELTAVNNNTDVDFEFVEFNNESISIALSGYFKLNDSSNMLDNLAGCSFKYEISYFTGASGELFELGNEYLQINEPSIYFTVTELETSDQTVPF